MVLGLDVWVRVWRGCWEMEHWRCAGARDGIVGKLFLATDQTDDEWHCSSRVSRVSFLETGNRYP